MQSCFVRLSKFNERFEIFEAVYQIFFVLVVERQAGDFFKTNRLDCVAVLRRYREIFVDVSVADFVAVSVLQAGNHEKARVGVRFAQGKLHWRACAIISFAVECGVSRIVGRTFRKLSRDAGRNVERVISFVAVIVRSVADKDAAG